MIGISITPTATSPVVLIATSKLPISSVLTTAFEQCLPTRCLHLELIDLNMSTFLLYKALSGPETIKFPTGYLPIGRDILSVLSPSKALEQPFAGLL